MPDPLAAFPLTVSTPDGPRAQVPDPPFDDVLPVAGTTEEPMPGGGSTVLPFLYLTDAPAFLAGDRRPGSTLGISTTLFLHSTGNAYVGLTVTESAPDGPDLVVKVALDPVAHRRTLDLAAERGVLCLARIREAPEGHRTRAILPLTVDSPTLTTLTHAALTHPRTVLVAASLPDRVHRELP